MTRSNLSLQFWKRSGFDLIRLLRSSICRIPFCVYLKRKVKEHSRKHRMVIYHALHINRLSASPTLGSEADWLWGKQVWYSDLGDGLWAFVGQHHSQQQGHTMVASMLALHKLQHPLVVFVRYRLAIYECSVEEKEFHCISGQHQLYWLYLD